MKKMQKLVVEIFFVLSLMMTQNSLAGTILSYSPESIRTIGDQTGASCAVAQHGSVGLFILLGLGAVYGVKKMYDYRKSLPKEQRGGMTNDT